MVPRAECRRNLSAFHPMRLSPVRALLIGLSLLALIGILGGAALFTTPQAPCIDGLAPGTGILPPGAHNIGTECTTLRDGGYWLAWFDIDSADLDLLTAALPNITLVDDPPHWAIIRQKPRTSGEVQSFTCGADI